MNRSLRPLSILLVGIFGFAGTCSSAVAAEPSGRPLQALLVTGGCCHDYDRQKLILPRGLSQRADIQWTVVQQGGSATDARIPLYDDPDWAEGFDVVVHNECFANVKDPAWLERILAPHRAGTPAVLIHCAMHCYRVGNDHWFEFCGLQSPGHGPHYAYQVVNQAPGHPIMRGFGDSWTVPKGELYHAEKLWPNAVPLAQADRKSDGKPQVCVWTNQFHKARVFATTIGHYNETMAQPPYLDLLTRGLLWAVHGDEAPALRETSEAQQAEILELVAAPTHQGNASPQSLAACCGQADVALGATATASSEETGKKNFAKHAVDGRLDTRWCAAGPASGEWLQIDFGQPQPIENLRIHWEQPGNAYRYRVAVSDDGEAWESVVDASENKQRRRIVTHPIDPVTARYLRVTFLGSSKGSWGSIWELEAAADDLPELPESLLSPQTTGATIADVKAPKGFEVRMFAAPPQVGYPVCLTAAPNGDVYVGVDEQGSLGKEAGRGKIVRCRDLDGDGQADTFTTFTHIDHPRGLVYDDGTLWVLHPPTLTRFRDHDRDGVADEETTLITGISTDQVNQRGADHTTNGIRMGIDGWIYIAVGDFGFHEARGIDGTELQRRGGGVVRVRPDGTDMEIYAWGLRNILDVCIDPYLNMFTRDNTNDGGGWDVRLSHIIQEASYGYPSKYLHYTDETMPPLADYGGGSGCGSMYLFDPRWPAAFGDAAYTCDWGTSKVYRHRLPASGPTFQADQDVFLDLPRPTDIDLDTSGRLYVSSWKNGGFNFSDENVGFVAQLMPQGFLPKPFPQLGLLSDNELLKILRAGASVPALHAQREWLRRGEAAERSGPLEAVIRDREAPLAGRVAALMTFHQLAGAEARPTLIELAEGDAALKPFALRALTDRRDQLAGLPVPLFVSALHSDDARVQRQALISLVRLAEEGAIAEPETVAEAVLPWSVIRDAEGNVRQQPLVHDQPDAARVIPHLAMQALVALQADEACLAALDGPAHSGALRALRQMHTEAAVDGIIARLEQADAPERSVLFDLLARLYFREGDYTDSDWWGTRPDTSGPYYDRQPWAASPRIAMVLNTALQQADSTVRASLDRYKVKLGKGSPNKQAMASSQEEAFVIGEVDPNNPHLIGNLPAEEVVRRARRLPGRAEAGEQFFVSQSCIACHTNAEGQRPKGPHLVDIGKRYKREELIESLLDPSAKLAQGFETWSLLTVDGQVETGFVVTESAETVTIRQNNGIAKEIPQEAIEFRKKQELSMMPAGVVDNLTVKQFADLLAYLESLQ